jgi:hypothetical protein
MGTTNKIVFWPLNHVVHFFFYFFLNSLGHLEFIKNKFQKWKFFSFSQTSLYIFY